MATLSDRSKIILPMGVVATAAIAFGAFCWAYFSSAQEANKEGLDKAVAAMSERMDKFLGQAQDQAREALDQTNILVNEMKHVNSNLGKIDEKMDGYIKQMADIAMIVGQLQSDYRHLSERVSRLESK